MKKKYISHLPVDYRVCGVRHLAPDQVPGSFQSDYAGSFSRRYRLRSRCRSRLPDHASKILDVLCVPSERSRDILEVSVKARTATNIPVVEANKNAGRGMSAL